jgi:UDP-N-acetylglucosamine 2-epimerase
MTIVGARPQFIKAFPVSRQIRQQHEEFLVHTGQHYDYEMSKLMFDELDVPLPDINLEVGSGKHGEQTARMLVRLEQELEKVNPDVAVVYGDTNSTLSGALAASKLGIAVAHVEAGMRCGDMSMPEEINRKVTDSLSTLLFSSTRSAVQNLELEGIREGVHLVGDVMVDSLELALPIAERKKGLLDNLGLVPSEFVLCTVHRASNTAVPQLERIVEAIQRLGRTVVFPVHPRTDRVLRAHGLLGPLEKAPPILLLRPVSYVENIVLEKNARVVLTDSGGMQKEAYLLGTPCLTLREETEWTETVDAGWNLLVGTDPAVIAEAVESFRPECDRPDIFGDGLASQRIASILGDTWSSR